ncbi:ABC transporter permease [Kitasatospora sp. NPDC058170]|uniref:ABC transporter permease n=1 Tax=Kitasatospora sp. NPDC058170 TaxID=3346364 RepID=UPI0036D7ABBF
MSPLAAPSPSPTRPAGSSTEPPGPGPRAEPPARFGDLVAAEWIKMWSLRSTPWALALVTLFTVGSSWVVSMADRSRLAGLDPGELRDGGFLFFDAYPMAGWLTLMLVAGCVGGLAVVSEYGSGLIRTTTVAVPARGSVLLAKAAVVAAVWTVVGAVISIGSFAVSQAALSGCHADVAIGHPGVPRAVLASALLAPVCALIGLGLGALVRHGAGATATTMFVLLLLPPFFSTSRHWSADINHAMVASAWKRLIQGWSPPPGSGSGFQDPTVAGSWTVLALWPLAAVLLGLVAVRRRDV